MPDSLSSTVAIRNAIALNNMGISMIEKHCYGQGTDTLKEAYQLIRKIVLLSEGNDKANTSDSHAIVEDTDAYHRALVRLSNSKPCKRKSFVNFESITPMIKEEILIDNSPITKTYFIRIEDVYSLNGYGNITPSTECAIIMNNLALAYLLMSSIAPHDEYAKRHSKIACNLIRLSCSMYTQIVEKHGNGIEINPEPYRLMAIMISNTEKTLLLSGMNAEEYRCIFGAKLTQLRIQIQKIETIFFACANGVTAPAAAMA